MERAHAPKSANHRKRARLVCIFRKYQSKANTIAVNVIVARNSNIGKPKMSPLIHFLTGVPWWRLVTWNQVQTQSERVAIVKCDSTVTLLAKDFGESQNKSRKSSPQLRMLMVKLSLNVRYNGEWLGRSWRVDGNDADDDYCKQVTPVCTWAGSGVWRKMVRPGDGIEVGRIWVWKASHQLGGRFAFVENLLVFSFMKCPGMGFKKHNG